MTMTLVETITVGSGGAASIEFTGIPGDGKDLILKMSGRNTYAAADRSIDFSFNGSTADRTVVNLKGSGSAASSDTGISLSIQAATTTANTFTVIDFYFSNYSGDTSKSVSIEQATENNATAVEALLMALNWNQTAAITSLGFSFGDGNWAEHSTASLYKIS